MLDQFTNLLKSSKNQENCIFNFKQGEIEQKVIFQIYKPDFFEFEQKESNQIQKVKQIENQYNNQTQRFIHKFLNDEKNLNIIPKRSNIDLKNHIKSKMEKINHKTEAAIIQLLKKKINIDNPKIEKQEQINEVQNYVPSFGNKKYYQDLSSHNLTKEISILDKIVKDFDKDSDSDDDDI